MAIRPDQPQSIGGVLDTMLRLYRASLPSLMPICLVAAVASLPGSLYQLRFRAQLESRDLQQTFAALAAMFTDPLYWAVVVVGVLLQLWVIAALTRQLHAIGSDQPQSTKAALGDAVRPVGPLFLLWVLYFLVSLVGTLLLIIPGVILAVSLILGFILLLVEGKGPMAALWASHRLIWGCWWRTTAILTVGAIILAVVYMAVGLVIGLVLLFAEDSSQTFEILVSAATTFFATLVLVPLYPALLLAIYWDLKLRKQGGDLAARVGALGAGA
jgi:hypothetical protein